MQLLPTEKKKMAVEIPQGMEDVFKLEDNLEGIIPRLPQINIIHQGAMYEMPDGEKVEKFEAIILDHHSANAWWEKSIEERKAAGIEGSPIPDCFSFDGLIPAENCKSKNSDVCREGANLICSYNQFGSDRKSGRGKDCKNMRRIIIIMEGVAFPRRLTLSPISLGQKKDEPNLFDSYMIQLTDRGLHYRCAVTEFYLKLIVDGDLKYSRVLCKFARVLDQKEMVIIGDLTKQYSEARTQEIRADEYKTTETEEEVPTGTEGTESPEKKSWFGKKKEEPDSDIPF